MLLPFRDAGAWVDEAITSVRNQSLTHFEVLAVDDGSVDRSRERIELWRSEDPRVRVLETTPDARGIVAALEVARREVSSDLLIRMDADDVAPPDRFDAQVSFLAEHADVVACGTPVKRFPAERVTDGGRAYEAWINGLATPALILRDLYVECPIAHPTLAVRASAMEQIGGYRTGPFPEDYDLILRLAAVGGRLAQVPCSPFLWRDHPDQLQRTDVRYSIGAFRALKVEHLLSGPLRPERPVVVIGSGPTGKAFAKLLTGAGQPVEAFVDLDPRKIGQTIHGIPVIAADTLGSPRGRVALSAVSGIEARTTIRAMLRGLGWVERADFWAVA